MLCILPSWQTKAEQKQHKKTTENTFLDEKRFKGRNCLLYQMNTVNLGYKATAGTSILVSL
jgi:hypothetical protein